MTHEHEKLRMRKMRRKTRKQLFKNEREYRDFLLKLHLILLLLHTDDESESESERLRHED